MGVPEICLTATEIVSSTTEGEFDLGNSYGKCGYIETEGGCVEPLGAGKATTFYIGYKDHKHDLNLGTVYWTEATGVTSFGPVT